MKLAEFRAVAAAPVGAPAATAVSIPTLVFATALLAFVAAPGVARGEASSAPLARSAPGAWGASGTSDASDASAFGGPGAIELPPFRGALDEYRGYRSESVTPWRDSNERVGRIGGWRVYAREAFVPQTPSAPAADERPGGGGSGAGAATGGGR